MCRVKHRSCNYTFFHSKISTLNHYGFPKLETSEITCEVQMECLHDEVITMLHQQSNALFW